jgi:hypothetical protein
VAGQLLTEGSTITISQSMLGILGVFMPTPTSFYQRNTGLVQFIYQTSQSHQIVPGEERLQVEKQSPLGDATQNPTTIGRLINSG